MENVIVKVKYGKRTIKYVRPNAVIQVLNQFTPDEFKKKKTWEERYFIVSFLFWTGVRASELILTKREDIDFIGKIYYAPTLKKWRRKKKNGEKSEDIPKAKRIEKRAIGLDHVPIDTLRFWERFLSGKKFGERIVSIRTRYGVFRAVKEFFEYFGIKGVHPHMLRHSIAVYLASNNVPINALAAFLRHSNPANTAIYYSIIGLDTKPFLQRVYEMRLRGEEVLI